MRKFSSLSLFVFSALLIPQASAWGSVGHEIVATIAQMHLHPSVMPKLCDILDLPANKCHLAPVAAWADSARRQAKYRWTGPLHYIGAVDDYPSTTCAFPGPQGWEGRTHINVLNGIRNTTTVLHQFEQLRRAGVQPETVPPYVEDALKFLIHFIGDMHQPLHLTGRDRGGNNVKVMFDGRTTNLHSVWDTLLISERLRTLPWNYTLPLPLPEVESHLRDTIYDPYIRRLVWEGLLDKWQDDLDAWVTCPTSTPSTQRQPQPTSTWQTVLSLFSSLKGTDESEDGGLGVDDDMLCPFAWGQSIHPLNCDIVFPKALDAPSSFSPSSRVFQPGPGHDDEHVCDCDDDDTSDITDDSELKHKKAQYLELYTADYTGQIKREWIVEKLVTQAGIRLAAVLNWIFAELDKDEARSVRVRYT